VKSIAWLGLPFIVAFVRGTPRFTPDVRDKEDDRDFSGIRCPACKWRPTRNDTWMCECGEIWNTFATRGECPGCQKRWTKTQCRQCGTWSDHDAWYEKRPVNRPS
jgi:hypothetical protein